MVEILVRMIILEYHSVVDYCIVNREDLQLFSDFQVHKVTDLINFAGHSQVLYSTSYLDHSILTWKWDLSGSVDCHIGDVSDISQNVTHIKYDVRHIPESFMKDNDVVQALHNTVIQLEHSLHSQFDIDNAYDTLCSQIKQCMSDS